MSFEPRWYQSEAASAALNTTSPNPILALPTGSGKSMIQGLMVQGFLKQNPNARILLGVHSKILVEQNAKTLRRMIPSADIGIACAGLGKHQFDHQIVLGSVGTLVNALNKIGPREQFIIDECHRVSCQKGTGYEKLVTLGKFHLPDTFRTYGLSATPYRLGFGHLTDGDIFTDVVYDISTGENYIRLVDENYLAPLVTQSSDIRVNMRDVKKVRGDFDSSMAAHAVRQALERVLPDMIGRLFGRESVMIFVSGIDNVEYVTAWLNENGQGAVCAHSKQQTSKNDEALTEFKTGLARFIVSCGTLTTGFDHPPVDAIVLLKATNSTALNVQMLGRGTRVYDGKLDCLVLDYVGNLGRCGPINDPIIPKKNGDGPAGEAPYRTCPVCDNDCHASLRSCPYCGFEFPPGEVRIKGVVPGVEAMRRSKPIKLWKKRVWLYHPSTDKAQLVADTKGFEYARVQVGKHFSFLLNTKNAHLENIQGLSTSSEIVSHVVSHGLPGGFRQWDISAGQYAALVRSKTPPKPSDCYWFPAISETAKAEFIAAILENRNMDENIVKATLRAASSRLIQPEHCQHQATILRHAFDKRNMLNLSAVTEYVENIIKEHRADTALRADADQH